MKGMRISFVIDDPVKVQKSDHTYTCGLLRESFLEMSMSAPKTVRIFELCSGGPFLPIWLRFSVKRFSNRIHEAFYPPIE